MRVYRFAVQTGAFVRLSPATHDLTNRLARIASVFVLLGRKERPKTGFSVLAAQEMEREPKNERDRQTSHANDFVNAKSHARGKLLLAGYEYSSVVHINYFNLITLSKLKFK